MEDVTARTSQAAFSVTRRLTIASTSDRNDCVTSICNRNHFTQRQYRALTLAFIGIKHLELVHSNQAVIYALFVSTGEVSVLNLPRALAVEAARHQNYRWPCRMS